MSKTAWPTTVEVTDRIEGLGAAVPAGITLEDEVSAIVAALEDCSGFRPFLAESVDSEREYDSPEGCQMNFRGGYKSVTSIETTDGGDVLTEGTDYDLEPANADDDDRPFRRVRFRGAYRYSPRYFTVTGKRGFSDVIPLPVWNAVRDAAAALAIETYLQQSAGGTLKRIKQGPVELEYSQAEAQDIVSKLRAPLDKVLASGAYSRGRL